MGVTIRQLGTVVLGLVWVVLNFFSHVFFNFFNFSISILLVILPISLTFLDFLFFFLFLFLFFSLLTPSEPPFSEIIAMYSVQREGHVVQP